MAVTRERTAPPGKAEAAAAAAAERDFVREIGRLVRLGRARRGVSRRRLAQDSGISERYLAQIEAGEGNPSAIVLRALAQAIDVPLAELLPQGGGRGAAMARILGLLGAAPPSALSPLADLIEARLAPEAGSDRARRIALVGLRGAGKSTLGRLLARRLNMPFVELNQMVAQDCGAEASVLIEMSGIATFRRYERACLERLVAEHEQVVIATAGGIVSNPESYALLLRRTHTVWLQARPEEHLQRVIAQGDFRPMAHNRETMADLVAILEARRADYARAEARLDTAGASVQASLARLLRIVAPWTKAG